MLILLFQFICLPFGFPFFKLFFAYIAFKEGHNIGKKTPDKRFSGIL